MRAAILVLSLAGTGLLIRSFTIASRRVDRMLDDLPDPPDRPDPPDLPDLPAGEYADLRMPVSPGGGRQ
ncbi:hypothetical protein [Winogradskya humida]|uniref:Ti type entry exclusion protein TrbK n=1 Tax=Winogradskya humida TaxID=113566 RepID=A0ABQ3ZJN0_9ACTN|nr:hypothetical protein [Actinoplanes humidus]GIE18796.1 hypothetical protein Ahu01nite_018980 [Actinoplanes humidus]